MVGLAMLIVFGAGCIGGLVNSIFIGSNLFPEKNSSGVTKPGIAVCVFLGGVAGVVVWALSDVVSAMTVLGQSDTTIKVSLTVGEVATSLIAGVGGIQVLKDYFDKETLQRDKETLQRDKDTLQYTLDQALTGAPKPAPTGTPKTP